MSGNEYDARARRSAQAGDSGAKGDQKLVNKVYDVEAIFTEVMAKLKAKAKSKTAVTELKKIEADMTTLLTKIRWAKSMKKHMNHKSTVGEDMAKFEKGNWFAKVPGKFRR